MSNDREHYQENEEGIAIEVAKDKGQSFVANSDNIFFVPAEDLRKKKKKSVSKAKKRKIKR